MDISVKSDKINGEEKFLPHATTQQEDKRSQASDAMVTESSKPKQTKRTSEIRGGNETKLTGAGANTLGIQEKAENKIVTNATNNTKSSESVLRGRDAAAAVQDTQTTNVQSHHKVQTKEFVVQSKSTFRSSETIVPPSYEPSRSQITGHRQLPVAPRLSQPTRENASNSYSNEGHTETTEKRTSFAKPSSGVSSKPKSMQQSVAVPKSTEAHPASTAPQPRSSGSTTAPVVLRSSGSNSGRSQDTSGYPDAFHKRRSRDSREINDTALNQLGRSRPRDGFSVILFFFALVILSFLTLLYLIKVNSLHFSVIVTQFSRQSENNVKVWFVQSLQINIITKGHKFLK